jgi:hypothetical protein
LAFIRQIRLLNSTQLKRCVTSKKNVKENPMKMTPSFSLIFLFAFLICLSACNAAPDAAPTIGVTPQINTQPGYTSTPQAKTQPGYTSTPKANPQADNTSLPLAAQLAVGTLKLEGTDHAVTTQQAAQLLLLWQAYRTLSASDTAALVELEAIIQQIQATLTPEQTQAIEAMQLTRQLMSETLLALGIDPESEGTPGPQETPSVGTTLPVGNGGGPGNGKGRGGGPGGGGPETGTGDEVDTGVPANDLGQPPGNQKTPGANAQSVRVSPVLLDALIKILVTKAQS